MTLVRRSPWQDLETLQRHMQDIFGGSLDAAPMDTSQWVPAVDVRETDDALLVQAELPGMEKKDITVEVKDGVLKISGERRYEKDVKEENTHRIERAYGSFSRSFYLPRNVDGNAVEATLKDGVLDVRLPKLESATTKAIEIK